MDWTGTGKRVNFNTKMNSYPYVAELAVHNATQEQMVVT